MLFLTAKTERNLPRGLFEPLIEQIDQLTPPNKKQRKAMRRLHIDFGNATLNYSVVTNRAAMKYNALTLRLPRRRNSGDTVSHANSSIHFLGDEFR